MVFCVVCTRTTPPLLTLNDDEMSIYEIMVSPFINLEPLIKSHTILVCSNCKGQIDQMQHFRAIAVAGARHLQDFLMDFDSNEAMDRGEEATQHEPKYKTESETALKPKIEKEHVGCELKIELEMESQEEYVESVGVTAGEATTAVDPPRDSGWGSVHLTHTSPSNEAKLQTARRLTNGSSGDTATPSTSGAQSKTQQTRVSDHIKHRIIMMWEDRVPISQIAEEVGVMRSTVYLWVKRYKEEGNVRNHASKGRPRKTTQQQDLQLAEDVKNQRFVRTTDLAMPLAVSTHTVRRRLLEAGLKHHTPAKKPLLTHRHKEWRLAFANRYLNYDFQNVVFMGEKVFVTSADGRLSLLRIHKSRNVEQNVLPNQRSGRISVGFWGFMNSGGPIELCEISGRLSSQGYVGLLRDVFLPSAKLLYPDGHVIEFMQDNSPIHNARHVQAWVDNNKEFNLIKMPPRSPDLNPIENVWRLIVQEWDATKARTIDSLRAHVHEIWEKYKGTGVCENMVSSMKDRLQAVKDADGGYTKY